jgi:hypothetical protein
MTIAPAVLEHPALTAPGAAVLLRISDPVRRYVGPASHTR